MVEKNGARSPQWLRLGGENKKIGIQSMLGLWLRDLWGRGWVVWEK